MIRSIKSVAIQTEHDEQVSFVQWFKLMFPGALIIANLNGGFRHWKTAKSLKKEGSLPGVADLTVYWNNGRVLFIEMKRKKGGVQSEAQKGFERKVTEIGHGYILAKGFDDAVKKINEYLREI